jgi:hypothetical protein
MAVGDVVFQVFQAFQSYVSSIASQFCKSRSEMLHMLQWQYMHVTSICFNCFMCFERFISNVLPECFKVDLALHMLQWLYTYVPNTCFKCFIYLQTYVAYVSSRCFKSRSGVVRRGRWWRAACRRALAPASCLSRGMGGARHCRGGRSRCRQERERIRGWRHEQERVLSPSVFLVELSPCVTLAGIIGFCWTPVGSPSPCIDSRLAGGSLLGPDALLGPDVRPLVPSIINTN